MLGSTTPPSTPWKRGLAGKTDTVVNIPYRTYEGAVDLEKLKELEERTGLLNAEIISKIDRSLIKVDEDLHDMAQEANDFAAVAKANQEKMETEINKVQAIIGKPVRVDGLSVLTVWSAIGYLMDKATQNSQLDHASSAAFSKATKDIA
jgi:hypothetical protein